MEDAFLLNGTALAFLGDAVMSLQVREYLIKEKHLQNTNRLQQESIKFVSAKAQAQALYRMLDENVLNETEIAIVKRGRNAKTETKAKHAAVHEYRMATGLEALWGYLYLMGQQERLDTLWQYIIEMKEV